MIYLRRIVYLGNLFGLSNIIFVVFQPFPQRRIHWRCCNSTSVARQLWLKVGEKWCSFPTIWAWMACWTPCPTAMPPGCGMTGWDGGQEVQPISKLELTQLFQEGKTLRNPREPSRILQTSPSLAAPFFTVAPHEVIRQYTPCSPLPKKSPWHFHWVNHPQLGHCHSAPLSFRDFPIRFATFNKASNVVKTIIHHPPNHHKWVARAIPKWSG